MGSALAASGAQANPPVDYGFSVGLPQLIALSIEKPMSSRTSLQLNLGTMVFISSASVRAIISPSTGSTKPYAFVGPGFAFGLAEPYVVPTASAGIGLRQEIGAGAHIFAEGGVMTLHVNDGRWSVRNPDVLPAAAFGFVFSRADPP